MMQVIPLRKDIPNAAYGHSFFSWHKQVMDFVLDFVDSHPEYVKRFRYTNCCDEIFFHTMLLPHIERLNINPTTSLRYVDWSKPKLLLTEDDYDKIIASGNLFCKKIDPVVSKKLKEMIKSRMH